MVVFCLCPRRPRIRVHVPPVQKGLYLGSGKVQAQKQLFCGSIHVDLAALIFNGNCHWHPADLQLPACFNAEFGKEIRLFCSEQLQEIFNSPSCCLVLLTLVQKALCLGLMEGGKIQEGVGACSQQNQRNQDCQ